MTTSLVLMITVKLMHLPTWLETTLETTSASKVSRKKYLVLLLPRNLKMLKLTKPAQAVHLMPNYPKVHKDLPHANQ